MKKFLLVVAFLTVFSGCRKATDAAADRRQPQKVGPTAIEGLWISYCQPDGQESYAKSWKFEGDHFESKAYFFSDSDCREFKYEGEGLRGTFELPGGNKIDLHGRDAADAEMHLYDIFEIRDGTLYFGNYPGDNDAGRATEINPYWPFVKA